MTDIFFRTPKTADEKRRADVAEADAEFRQRLAASNAQRSTGIAGAHDLSQLEWPAAQYYGYDHARATSQLAVYIAADVLGLPARDVAVVKAAAFFHDAGRSEGWQKPDLHHAERSARAAELHMRQDPAFRADATLREEVCRLILQHDLERKELPQDPRAMCLHDADAFEAARIAPGTVEGAQLLQRRMRSERLCLDWSRLTEHQRRWRVRYWK